MLETGSDAVAEICPSWKRPSAVATTSQTFIKPKLLPLRTRGPPPNGK